MQKNKFKIKLLILSVVFLLSLNASAAERVYIGGFPFGVQMTTDGVFVSGVGEIESTVGKVSPAADAGILPGDIILSVNGVPADSVDSVSDVISHSSGKRIKIELKRDGKELSANIIPVKSADGSGYKTGLYIKDSASGIGTVTFVKEDGRVFGGLGHGITDRYTLGILPLGEGTVHDVVIKDVAKGSDQMPGELKGALDPRVTGQLVKNTEMGIFGVFDSEKTGLEEIMTAEPGQIKEGECKIYACIEGNTPQAFNAQISKIIDKKSKTKNFIITLTDKEGLKKTGGIVQGMSGSPVVQNGKLVGAVTHVLMKDQKSGYGIFIENMLEEAGEVK